MTSAWPGKNRMNRRLALPAMLASVLLAVSALASHAANAASAPVEDKFIEVPASAELLAKVRQGGFVLYLRHGYTDNSRPDRVPTLDLDDCSTQRPLTEEGRQLARRVGESIRKARLPIGEIRASPLCRAKETAQAAFPGKAFTIDKLLMYTANLTDAQKVPIIANTRRLLAAAVAPGSNRLLVAHAPNLMDLLGYFPKEGTLVIFRPVGGRDGFVYVASIAPALWGELMRQEHK
jgi:phosphohistidine phosphatase SixA